MIDRMNPPGLHTPPGYHHVNVAPISRHVFLAGQCPVDAAGAVVGVGDLTAQVDQVAANIVTALAAVGLGPADVVRTVIYVVPTDPADLRAVWRRLRESPVAAALESASTLLGVAQLAFPGQLLEVDVTAVGG
jgi:enamine deaminase RidA (YjgF/YER057c/UK114 family)